ncbi:hypothetical protein [Pseudoclavibacter sp. CFCC 13796]|nr:hypothetical protein [Pseudoclavibacter sp. CFCC 13796]
MDTFESTQSARHDEGTRFFRGLGYGLAFSLPVWAAIGATVWRVTLYR